MTVTGVVKAPIGMMARARARYRLTHEAPPMTTSAWLALAATGALLGGGLIMILSASWVSAFQNYGSSFLFFGRQLLWASIGLAVMAALAHLDYRRLRLLVWPLVILSFAGLIAVLVPGIGTRVYGSSRWIAFGSLRFQPSELAKLALLLAGADLCTRPAARLRTYTDIVKPFGGIALGMGLLVMMQPDLGTTIILGGITMTALFLAGARMRVLSGMAVGVVSAAGVLALSAGYRRARIFGFTNPFADPLNTGYQAVQSQIALGSGGLFGVGLGAGRQKWLYVPNAHTDFIFSIIGEEVGLLGTFAVLSLFALLAYAGVRTARRAPDAFGRVLAGTITAWIAGQAVINMGAVTGLMPITGVPLPLVSFGGSSLVFTLAAIGILLSIARREQWPQVREENAPPATAPSARPTRGRRPGGGAQRSGRTVSARQAAAPRRASTRRRSAEPARARPPVASSRARRSDVPPRAASPATTPWSPFPTRPAEPPASRRSRVSGGR